MNRFWLRKNADKKCLFVFQFLMSQWMPALWADSQSWTWKHAQSFTESDLSIRHSHMSASIQKTQSALSHGAFVTLQMCFFIETL